MTTATLEAVIRKAVEEHTNTNVRPFATENLNKLKFSVTVDGETHIISIDKSFGFSC